jgi:hypothetical protein
VPRLCTLRAGGGGAAVVDGHDHWMRGLRRIRIRAAGGGTPRPTPQWSRLLLLPLLLLAAQAAVPEVEVPRFTENVTIDGVLDEGVWSRAALIDGFWQYEPADGRRAADRTEVRVWYSPDALYFGITAYDSEPASIRATRADRDNIGGDDHVIIYLDTFLDRRRAFFFGVNPLGVQQDGVRTEGAVSPGRMFGGNIDRSPDFHYESRGRVTADGYTVEVRIPFRSLRYPAAEVMRWGLNIERKTQRTGFVDVWPAARRGSASFLAQGGTLAGLRDVRRGVVLELQPFVTMNAAGSRAQEEFVREALDPSAGANLRVGFSSISLDATLNPDFSQVEADVGQVTVNERFALFVPEKRPFFLEGIELFSTPNQLVYTRRITDPRAGGKVTGKTGPLSVAHMTAVDRGAAGTSGARAGDALFNVSRLRGDLGSNSLIGVTLTDRSLLEGSEFNRVLAGDARVVFGGVYYFEGQLGGSWTRHNGGTRSSPIWKLELDRTGRAFGFNYLLNAVGSDFESHAGFVNRAGVVSGRGFNRFTWYGPADGTLERITVFFGPSRVWSYAGVGSDAAIEGSEFANATFRLRGEWEVGARAGRDFVTLDPAAYQRFTIPSPAGPLPYAPLDKVSGPRYELSASTPVFQLFDARASVQAGRVAIFDEGSAGDARAVSGSVSVRSGAAVRLALTTTYQQIHRVVDGSEFARTVLPRLRAEYQPARAFFVRGIAEYRAERRRALRDARTGAPLAVDGVATGDTSFNTLRLDLLASYRPTPGTVAFLGYGASFNESESFGFSELSRTADGLFLKLAYQIRR